MTKQELIKSLEGKCFKNANGKELVIISGGYDTPSGYVRLARLNVSQLRQIAKVSLVTGPHGDGFCENCGAICEYDSELCLCPDCEAESIRID